MPNYRIKRNLSRLSVYTVAKELGVDYNKYMEVDRGFRPLESQYVDKFQEILNNATQIRLNRAQRMVQIRPMFINGEIKKKMQEYGYNVKELGDALDIAPTVISNSFNTNLKLTSDDTRERIYDFLSNPFNKKIANTTTDNNLDTTEEQVVIENTTKPIDYEEEFEKLNLEREIKKRGLKQNYVANIIGITPSHFYNIMCKKRNASYKVKKKIVDFILSGNIETTTPPPKPQKDNNKNRCGRKSIVPIPEIEEWYNTLDLKEEIVSGKYSLVQLANNLGVSQTFFRNVVNGHKNLSARLIVKLYDIFHDNIVGTPKNTTVGEQPKEEVKDIAPETESCIEKEIEEKPTIEEIKEINTMQLQVDALLKENERLRNQIDAYVKLIGRI